MRTQTRFALVVLVILAACSPITRPTLPATSTATPLPAATTPAGTQPVETPTVTPGGPLTLRIWLPPQFDPALDTPAGKLMRERLMEFSRQRPRVLLETRVKAEYGPGGLLDSLTTASAAAPSALPDLVALPRDVLETAALKGLLTAYNKSDLSVNEQEWYPFARELAHLQDSLYGLPFAGDAMAMVYRPSAATETPEDLPAILSGQETLIFPAADPEALFTLALYQAQGGAVRDEQSKPVIETVALTEVLTYYAQAKVSGVMDPGLTQFQSDEQVWNAFLEGRAQMVATWCTRYLSNNATVMDANVLLAPLPTANGQPYTLATGWVWSLSSRDSERQRVAVELANFLTDSGFLAGWTEAAGYLPPYPAALQQWQNEAAQPQMLDRIARTAHALPSSDILSTLSPPLWQATIEVLKGQNDPIAAAQEAAASLTAP